MSRLTMRVGSRVKSDAAERPTNGRRFRPSKLTTVACWACTAAAAWLINDEVEIDFWSISSDMLRFFRMGFLARNEFDFDSRLTGSDAC